MTFSLLPSAPTAPALAAQGFAGKTQLLQRFWLEQLEIRLNPLGIKGWSGWSGWTWENRALRKKTVIRTAVDSPQLRRANHESL